LADEAALAAKTANNNLNLAEQQRLVDEIEAKRAQDLLNLATSDIGLLAIKKQTADAIKAIEQASAAETFRIESDLKAKQEQAQWEHNLKVYAAQLAEWEAARELTVALLHLQMIKASGKIFNKAEKQAIKEALDAAIFSTPPLPPAGLFNKPGGSSGGSSSGGTSSGGTSTVSKGEKYEKGGTFNTKAGIVPGNTSHADGGYGSGTAVHAKKWVKWNLAKPMLY